MVYLLTFSCKCMQVYIPYMEHLGKATQCGQELAKTKNMCKGMQRGSIARGVQRYFSIEKCVMVIVCMSFFPSRQYVHILSMYIVPLLQIIRSFAAVRVFTNTCSKTEPVFSTKKGRRDSPSVQLLSQRTSIRKNSFLKEESQSFRRGDRC